ncbi:hypothetical protein [Jiangella asiatica]|uniref:HNH endonuclease n=1 Tax=Jiangella asiatica TaxID=2530372 RepID=A0A4R5CMW9_9ACTN|nr:hypothetical protein [Jiangella asiatica]TDD98904.1 hypothetical protein E1269_28280 [Jiangella asiatica]
MMARGGYRTTTPAYSSAHQRVAAARGDAAEHRCVDCGARALEWSYRGDSPDELINPRGLRYSPWPDDYEPRCILCHRINDRAKAVAA